MRRPPKYVQGFVDRHGKARFYFRRAGFKTVALPGLPWSPEFMQHYADAMTQEQPLGSDRLKAGSMHALAISYFNSPGFNTLQEITRQQYRRMIEAFCREQDKDGRPFGDKRAVTLQRDHIVRLMKARADRPDSANWLRKVLRAVMKHAVEIGMRHDDPTRDIQAIRVKTSGYHSWTEPEITQFEERHPIGTAARLAFALLLYTGQRRSDVIRMGRQHIRDGVITVKQQKTGVTLAIPVHADLHTAIAATAAGKLTLIVTEAGKPYGVGSFGNWFRKQCDLAGLPHCSAHGLRKAAARRLAEAGCTPHEIAAITGHATLKEIVRYTKAVDQTRLAVAAMDKMRTNTVKPARAV